MSDTGTQMTDTTRNLLIVLGVVVVLALVWLFVVNPLLSGEDDEVDDGPVATATDDPDDVETPAPDATETEEDVLETLPIETYEIFLSRDPFEPVVPVAAPADGDGGTVIDQDGDADGDADGGTDGDGTDGGTDDGTDGGADDDPCTSGDGEAVCEGIVVSLVDVFEEDGTLKADLNIGDTAGVIVTEGATFDEQGQPAAGPFEVLSIDPPCITLLFGDDSFTLCEGERILK